MECGGRGYCQGTGVLHMGDDDRKDRIDRMMSKTDEWTD